MKKRIALVLLTAVSGAAMTGAVQAETKQMPCQDFKLKVPTIEGGCVMPALSGAYAS